MKDQSVVLDPIEVSYCFPRIPCNVICCFRIQKCSLYCTVAWTREISSLRLLLPNPFLDELDIDFCFNPQMENKCVGISGKINLVPNQRRLLLFNSLFLISLGPKLYTNLRFDTTTHHPQLLFDRF